MAQATKKPAIKTPAEIVKYLDERIVEVRESYRQWVEFAERVDSYSSVYATLAVGAESAAIVLEEARAFILNELVEEPVTIVPE